MSDNLPQRRPSAAYPVRHHGVDDRFTTTLVCDIAAVLAAHGYPPLENANDLLHLSNRLHDAIYQPRGTR